MEPPGEEEKKRGGEEERRRREEKRRGDPDSWASGTFDLSLRQRRPPSARERNGCGATTVAAPIRAATA
jgi:hypothetical protein